MASDLVTRAREVADRPDCSYGGTMGRLADRIEALEAALQMIESFAGNDPRCERDASLWQIYTTARRTLQEASNGEKA